MTYPIGGTMNGQHQRTVEMLIEMKSLPEMLWFLYDSQTELKDLKTLAEIAQNAQRNELKP